MLSKAFRRRGLALYGQLNDPAGLGGFVAHAKRSNESTTLKPERLLKAFIEREEQDDKQLQAGLEEMRKRRPPRRNSK